MLRDLDTVFLARIEREINSLADGHPFREVSQRIVRQISNRQPNLLLPTLEKTAEASLPLQWCLRDVHEGNVLFQGDVVTGLVDFGAATVDSLCGDLARLIRSLAEGDRVLWQECLDSYRAIHPLSKAESQGIALFDQSGIVCSAANWMRWIHVERRGFVSEKATLGRLRLLATRLNQLEASCFAS